MRLAFVATLVLATACGSDKVSSEEDARRAYLGLDRAIDRALNLGMAGYNAASSANIPPQSAAGDVSGTLTVTGHVDQGVSPNKEMNLGAELVMYQDRAGVFGSDAGNETATGITYDTDPAALPALQLSLRNIPNGTFTGSLDGIVRMSGDLRGSVELTISLAGNIEEIPGTAQQIRRVPGTTRVTGTARSDYGTYAIDLTH
jgi:hypothetical protein